MICICDKEDNLFEFVAVRRVKTMIQTGRTVESVSGVPEDEIIPGFAIVGTLPDGTDIEVSYCIKGPDEGDSESRQVMRALRGLWEDHKVFKFLR